MKKMTALVFLFLFLFLFFLILITINCTSAIGKIIKPKILNYYDANKKLAKIIDDYNSGVVKQSAFPVGEAGAVQGEIERITVDVQGLVRLLPSGKTKNKANEWLKGCRLTNEGINILIAGIINNDSLKIKIGTQQYKEGFEIMEKSEFVKELDKL